MKKAEYKGPFADWEYKDRVFKLNKKKSKLASKFIQTRSSAKRPLHYWDDELKRNRVLRYAVNFDSPFMDEQDEATVILGTIRFKHGTLYTDSTQVGLQRFLMLHREFGKTWTLVDKEAEAVDELAVLNMEYEAMKIARESDLELLEAVMRYQVSGSVDLMTSAEIKKDAQLLAKRNPKLFLELATDDNLILRNLAVKAVENGYLKISEDGNKVVWAKNGKKVIDVGFDDNPYAKLAQFFKKDEGIDLMKTLQAKFK